MGLLSVDQLKTGMVLENNLVAFNGRCLLPKGAVLTEKHLQTMKIWDVIEADIEGEASSNPVYEVSPDIPPGVFREAERSVQGLFSSLPVESPMKEMYAIALARTAEVFRDGAVHPFPDVLSPSGKQALKSAKIKGTVTPADLVSRELHLVSLPDVYYRVMEVIDSARSSAAYIAEVVSKDTSLLARLLELVNSALYGFPSKIETASRAVALIGTKELSILALGIIVVQYFNDTSPELVDMKSFWRHSVACGVYARLLASEKVGVSEEHLFVAGLLHDLGKLVFYRQIPLTAKDVMELAAAEKIPFCKAESELLGFDHAQVGALLLREWKIPGSLETIVRFHHNPLASGVPLEPALLNVADGLSIAAAPGRNGSLVIPEIPPEIWGKTGLSAAVFQSVIRLGDRQIDEITATFLGKGEH